MHRWILLLGICAGVTLALPACLSGDGAADRADVEVDMRDNVFDRAIYEVPVGGTVRFANVGRNPHNAIADDGSWSTEDAAGDLIIAAGDDTVVTFDQPGVYPFFCSFHSVDGQGMVATLVIGPTDTPLAAGTPPLASIVEFGGTTRNVPADYPTIQSAVDSADPGDLVLIERGTYHESVAVSTEDLVIRGVDRNEVVLDGEFEREHGVFVVADGVAVENLTAHSYLANGVYWSGVSGFRGSYLTSYHTGDYGIYAFDSSDGLLEYSLGSGSPDAGFYVGQCDPCNVIVHRVISEYNGLGYSGTNASSEMYILESIWRHNGAGLAPNSLDGELLPPAHDVTLIGNLIHDNSRRDVPFKNATYPANGNGLILAGVNDSLAERNRVINHVGSGILISPNLDKNFWFANRNTVRDNIVDGSGRADLALGGPAGEGNCFEGNDFSSSLPIGLEAFQPCAGMRFPVLFELGGTTDLLGRVAENGTETRPDAPVGSTPVPEPQPTMPEGANAPVIPAVDVFASYPLDLAAITIPALPADVTVSQSKGITVFGVTLATGPWSIFFGLWAYVMPFMLFGALLAIAMWDLVRRDDLSTPTMVLWLAVVLLIPFIGILAYFVFGKSQIPATRRAVVVGGGLGAYLVLLVVGALVGGIV